MTERKCGLCREPGHSKRTCPEPALLEVGKLMDAAIVATHKPGIVKGPWFGANRSGLCTWCADRYEEGDPIRSDGQGGWECKLGYEDEPQPAWHLPTAGNVGRDLPAGLNRIVLSDPSPTVEPMAETAAQAFLSAADQPEEPKTTISGQPEAERDSYGRYLMKDPRTGKYKTGYRGKPEGFTRATTFNKTLSDTFALSQWGKRNVAIGLTLRPDLLALAHGKDVRADKRELNAVVDQAETAAGNKVGANLGTALHNMTERMDAGLISLDQVPPAQLPEITAYAREIRRAGIKFDPRYIERSTMTSKFGEDVAGTMDRIGQLPDGSFVIGDLKTGRDPLEYGDKEIAIQLLTYALGVNEFGLYDWNTDSWEPGPKVREDLALVIHLPAQRDDGSPASCSLHWIDLADPDVMDAARASAFARRWRKKRGLHRPYAPVFASATSSWDDLFSNATTVAEAGLAWKAAKAAGVGLLELKRLVGLAQDNLRRLGVQG